MPNTCCANPIFNDRVNIQTDTSVPSSQTESFATSTPGIPCNVVTVSGDETYRGRQLEAHLTHVVEMRFRSGITPMMRLVVAGGIYNGAVLNIQSVRPVRKPGKMPLLELYCRELESP